MAGLAVAAGSFSATSSQQSALYGFLVLLFPVYVNQITLFEQDTLTLCISDRAQGGVLWKWLRQNAVEVPLFFFLTQTVTILLLLVIRGQDPAVVFPLETLLAAAPFYLIAIHRTAIWPDDRCFLFINRIFFPSVLTCVCSFILGWSLTAAPLARALELGLTVALLTVFWGCSLRVSPSRLAQYGSLALVVLMGLSLFSKTFPTFLPKYADWLTVVSFGLLMTLVMGVAESGRVTSKLMSDQPHYLPPNQYDDMTPTEFFEAGTNLATATCVPLLPCTILHPSTNIYYTLGVFLFAPVQYALWMFLRRRFTTRFWTPVSIVCGLAVPMLAIFGVTFGDPPRIPWTLHEIGALLTCMTASVALGAYYVYRSPLANAISRPLQLRPFLNSSVCFAWTGLLATVLAATASLWHFIVIQASGLPSDWPTRLWLLQVFYFVTAFLLIFVASRAHASRQPVTETPPASTEPPPPVEDASSGLKQRSMSPLRGVWISCRPLTSAIAGTLTSIVLMRLAEWPILYALAGGLPIVLATSFGFLTNDIYDRFKDLRSPQLKPIALGAVPLPIAYLTAAAIAALALALSIVVSGSRGLLGCAIILASVVLYSPVSYRLPQAKVFFTAFLVLTPVAYGCVTTRSWIPPALLMLLFFFIVGREVLLDSRDLSCDTASDIHTLSYYLGRLPSAVIGWGLMFSCSGIAVFLDASAMSFVFRVIAFAALLPCLYAYRHNEVRALRATRLALLFGCFGFLP